MKGQTNAKLASKGIQGESVNITLLTNQESHSDLIGAVITVSYGGVDTEYVWEGSEVTVKIPAMMDYSISVSEVEGYATPEGFSATSQLGYSRKLEMTYNTELVRVTLSADDSSSVNGQIVTINGEAFTYSGTAVTKKVPFGTEYTVSVNDKSGYITPASQTFTASESVRNLEMVYLELKMGVFIQGVSGRLYNKEQWNEQETVNGIAVLTDNCCFVVPAAQLPDQGYGLYWGGYGTSVSGVTSGIYDWVWQGDYDGEAQTTVIIESLKGETDSSGVVGAPAAEYCRNYIFPNGKKGYLCAGGEMQTLADNLSEVNTLMEILGTAISISYTWTSTQYDKDSAWFFVSRDRVSDRDKDTRLDVIPFCSIN